MLRSIETAARPIGSEIVMQCLYPYFMMVMAWIVGRLVLSGLSPKGRSESLAIVVGVCCFVILAGDVSFLHLTLNRVTTLGLVAIISLTIFFRRHYLFCDIDCREIGIIAALCLVSMSYFWLPALLHRANIILLEAGDYPSYVSMGSWLQARSITVPADLGAGYSPIQLKLADHQVHHLRLGALFLFAVYASLFGARAVVLYTSYTSWLIALQVVAFFGLARMVIPSSRLWPCTMAAFVFALNPLLNWTGYASFVPQVLGIALMMTVLAVGARMVDSALQGRAGGEWRSLCVTLGILLCASWSVYPEIMPVGLTMLGCYAAIVALQRRSAPGKLASLMLRVLASFALAIVLSPMTLAWGLKGLIEQLNVTPHGGEQVIDIWTVLRTMVGASFEPLIPAALERMGSVQAVAAAVILATASLGFLHVVRSGQAALVFAVIITGALLFLYVGHRYGYASELKEGGSKALLTWNYFKATQYLAPLVFLLGWGGAAHWMTRRSVPSGRSNMAAWALPMVPVTAVALFAIGQLQRVETSGSYINISSRVERTLDDVPPGRTLVALVGDDDVNYYNRWSVYALMPDRSIVTTIDGTVHDDKIARMLALSFPGFLRVPISSFVANDPSVPGEQAYKVSDMSHTTSAFNISRDGVIESYISKPEFSRGAFTVWNVAVPNIALTTSSGQRTFPVGDLSTVRADLLSSGSSGLMRLDGVPPQSGLLIDTNHISNSNADLPVLREISDLTRLIGPQMIANGGDSSMQWRRQYEGFDLTMSNFGFSRLLLRSHLRPGTYFLKIVFGDVWSEMQPATSGLGAYIGFDNHRESAVDLSHAANSTFYYRFVVPQESDIACGLGFGAWGAARGLIHIKTIVLAEAN